MVPLSRKLRIGPIPPFMAYTWGGVADSGTWSGPGPTPPWSSPVSFADDNAFQGDVAWQLNGAAHVQNVASTGTWNNISGPYSASFSITTPSVGNLVIVSVNFNVGSFGSFYSVTLSGDYSGSNPPSRFLEALGATGAQNTMNAFGVVVGSAPGDTVTLSGGGDEIVITYGAVVDEFAPPAGGWESVFTNVDLKSAAPDGDFSSGVGWYTAQWDGLTPVSARYAYYSYTLVVPFG